MIRLLPLTLLAACDPLGLGDFLVYQVAYLPPELGADCFPNGEIPDDVANDSSTFRAPDTLALYRDVDGVPYLEIDGVVLAGAKKDGPKSGYAFYADNVVVDVVSGTNPYTVYGYTTGTASEPYTLTNKTSTDVDLTLKHKGISGTKRVKVEQSCEGQACQDADTFSCTTTAKFIGTLVKDPDLTYEISGGASNTYVY